MTEGKHNLHTHSSGKTGLSSEFLYSVRGLPRNGAYRQYVCYVSYHNLDITQEPISQLTLDIGPSSRRPWRRRVTVSVTRVKSEGQSANLASDKTQAHKGKPAS